MKRLVTTVAVTVGLLAGAGPVGADIYATEGDGVGFYFQSSSPVNDIGYRLPNGHIVKRRNVRFTANWNLGSSVQLYWYRVGDWRVNQRVAVVGSMIRSHYKGRDGRAYCRIDLDRKTYRMREGTGPYAVARC